MTMTRKREKKRREGVKERKRLEVRGRGTEWRASSMI
jgi:hypothetical protein